MVLKACLVLRIITNEIARADVTERDRKCYGRLAVSWESNVVDCGQRFVSLFIISFGNPNAFIKEGEVYIFTRCLALSSIVSTSFSLLNVEEQGNTQASLHIPDGIHRQNELLCNINLFQKDAAFI